MIALVPARSGSKRIPNKNTKLLGGMPLIVWTLREAFDSEVFSGVYVSTDSKDIAQIAASWTGAKCYMRPPHMARDDSQDIEWVKQILGAIEYDHHKNASVCAPCSLGHSHWHDSEFAILRPTSPFRNAATIQRAKLQWDDIKKTFDVWCVCDFTRPGEKVLLREGDRVIHEECGRRVWQNGDPQKGYDSMRAIRRASEHPMKQWQYDPNSHELWSWMKAAHHQHLHSRPTQTLADSWVQTAGLEMAWCQTPLQLGTIAGDRVGGFVMEGPEALDLNTEEDWEQAENFLLQEARDAVNL